MTRSPDRLYDLLPVVHRRRDAEQGYPLRALLQVIAQQAEVVEDDIDRLYDNWFIETCEDWVVPYIAELIGYRAVHEAGEPVGRGTAQGRRLNRILVPRREVANTLRYRRRRGTLAMLELLAHDVAGWPARAVEFYQLLAWMQPLNHQRLARGRSADLRDGDTLDLVDGPFDRVAHTVDVRRVDARRTRGRYNIPSVGLFAWRLKAYPVTQAPACCLEPGAHAYTFSVLGNDAPLFTKPAAEPSPHHIAGPLNVPAPIRRRALERGVEDYYGDRHSFAIRVDGWAGYTANVPVPPEALIVADLSGWRYRPPRDHIAVDPVLGRLSFPPRSPRRMNVWVTYHYGFSDDMGGGEYPRPLTQPIDAVVYRVGPNGEFPRIKDALARWREEKPVHAVVEIMDSGVYVEPINLELDQDQSLQLRAAQRKRPVLRLMDWETAHPDALWVRGAEGSRFTLDGLLVTGRGVHGEGPLAGVTIRHCTLVPGWRIGPDCEPRHPAEPSLELTDTHAGVVIERTILGSIQVSQDEVRTDPIPIRLSDSILDATSPEREAIGAPSWPVAHAILTIQRTTVFGQIQTHAVELAENSIFAGHVHVARRQHGCMRFCYVTPGSNTPRRYRCQPDVAEEAARAAIPRLEVRPDARVRFSVGGVEPPTDPNALATGEANLELSFEIANPIPEVGDELVAAVTLHNHGPRDASSVEVTLTGTPGEGCLKFVEEATVPDDVFIPSQGRVTEGPVQDSVLWKAGALRAGSQAAMTLRNVEVLAACGPLTELKVAITSHTLVEGDYVTECVRRVRERVQPRFNSVRYGAPTYAQLAEYCPDEITRGAEDESEMGAFHDLFQPQRAANLEARLDEFVPAGMDVGIIYGS